MKLAYYPGCSLAGTAREYDDSLRSAARSLGIDLVELADWSCCGASSAHMTDHELAVGLASRNLELAWQRGMDVLVPCAACFQRLRHADRAVRKEPGRWGRSDDPPPIQIVHVTAFLSRPEILKKIGSLVVQPLAGLRAACYYGCLSLRTPEVTGAANFEDPRGLDDIVARLGAEPVRWSHKTECCSGSLSLARPDISRSLVGDILSAARRGGAQAIVVDCPMCQANLESRQLDPATGKSAGSPLPVFFVTELMVLAFTGRMDAVEWKRHLVDPRKTLAPLRPPPAGEGPADRLQG